MCPPKNLWKQNLIHRKTSPNTSVTARACFLLEYAVNLLHRKTFILSEKSYYQQLHGQRNCVIFSSESALQILRKHTEQYSCTVWLQAHGRGNWKMSGEQLQSASSSASEYRSLLSRWAENYYRRRLQILKRQRWFGEIFESAISDECSAALHLLIQSHLLWRIKIYCREKFPGYDLRQCLYRSPKRKIKWQRTYQDVLAKVEPLLRQFS